jgi:hypothetical protein
MKMKFLRKAEKKSAVKRKLTKSLHQGRLGDMSMTGGSVDVSDTLALIRGTKPNPNPIRDKSMKL